MHDAQNGHDANTPIKTPSEPRGWARLVSDVKSKMHERSAKQQEETSVDRATRRTANATVWLAIFTVVLAATSLGTVWILKNQLREMHEGGIDTHALADATEKMKDSAEKSAQASRDFADTAGDIKDSIDTAVNKLDAQAKGIEQSRKSSLSASTKTLNASIDSSKLDERAWVGNCFFGMERFEKDKPIRVSIKFCNSGKTPAYKVEDSIMWKVVPTLIDGPTEQELGRLISSPANAIAPQGSFIMRGGYNDSLPMTTIEASGQKTLDQFFDVLDAGTQFLYYFGNVRYTDAFGRPHTTQFCVFLANAKTKEMNYCRNYNELD
jgi:hypothetical protein